MKSKQRTAAHWADCQLCGVPVSKWHDRLEMLPDGQVIEICNDCFERRNPEPALKRFAWRAYKFFCIGKW